MPVRCTGLCRRNRGTHQLWCSCPGPGPTTRQKERYQTITTQPGLLGNWCRPTMVRLVRIQRWFRINRRWTGWFCIPCNQHCSGRWYDLMDNYRSTLKQVNQHLLGGNIWCSGWFSSHYPCCWFCNRAGCHYNWFSNQCGVLLCNSYLKSKLGYDDALDVFGIHGISGVWGALATVYLQRPS